MDWIHFEIVATAGHTAECRVWINGRELPQILQAEGLAVSSRWPYAYRYLSVCCVQPCGDYWLGRARHQSQGWVLLLQGPTEEGGDSSWVAAHVTVEEDTVTWSQFVRKVGVQSGQGEVWPYARIGPFTFSREQYMEALRCLRYQCDEPCCAERLQDEQKDDESADGE